MPSFPAALPILALLVPLAFASRAEPHRAVAARLPATHVDAPSADTTLGTVVVDEADRRHARVTAFWTPVEPGRAPSAYAGRALHDGGAADDGEVRFLPPDTLAGRYAVALYWPRLEPGHGRLATNVAVFVRDAAGRHDHRVDLRGGGDGWHELGVYRFPGGGRGYVEIINNSADGVVVVDAVRFVPVE